MARLGIDADVDLTRIRAAAPSVSSAADAVFTRRLMDHFPTLHRLFRRLYGERDDSLDQL